MKYIIFQTKWGYFGLLGTDAVLRRSFLPVSNPDLIKSSFLKEFPEAVLDRNLHKNLQKQIIDYFDGKIVVFDTDIAVFPDNFGDFSKNILSTCKKIKFGQTITYKDLAQKAGYPNASRAVGNVLSKNPIPLIIPCHRIIRSDGKMGGFTAPGGTNLKKRLIQHEKHFT